MNMKKVNEFYYRRKKLNENFFENVSFYGEFGKRHILTWIYDLYVYKHISFNRFSDLLKKYEDIVFPVKVFSRGRVSIGIIDSRDNEYSLEYSTDYKKITEYHVGRRKYPYDIVKEFVISKDGKITLKKIGAIQLNKNGTNREDIFSIEYKPDKKITRAYIEKKNATLEIVYTMQNEEFDRKVLECLFEVNSIEEYFDDVFPILAKIEKIGKVDSLSIKSNSKLETLSEIVFDNRIVIKYSFLEKINDSETCLHRRIISKDVDKFIIEH